MSRLRKNKKGSNTISKLKFRKMYNAKFLIFFAGIFVIAGIATILITSAATAPNAKTAEAETTTSTQNTIQVADANASGGNFLEFRAAAGNGGGAMQIPGLNPSRGPGRSSNQVLRQNTGFTGDYNGLGEVRITCGVSHHSYDDPIVNPGQVGAAHMHTFIGNAGTNAHSTYESLRAEPNGSTCAGGSVNKSSYWFPSLIDRSTNSVVNPTLAFVYYKTGYWGQDGRNIQDIPAGLRIVSGTAAATQPQDEWIASWACTEHDGSGVPGGTVYASGSHIPTCSQNRLLEAVIMFPQCWNGRDLDSSNHKSHMAHPNFQGQCPSSHPVLIPQITVHGTWNMTASGTTNLYLSSDMMLPAGAPSGQGLHADFMEAWDPASRQSFVTNCLNARKDCGVRALGDGYSLIDP